MTNQWSGERLLLLLADKQGLPPCCNETAACVHVGLLLPSLPTTRLSE